MDQCEADYAKKLAFLEEEHRKEIADLKVFVRTFALNCIWPIFRLKIRRKIRLIWRNGKKQSKR
jgi:hypothetical protein